MNNQTIKNDKRVDRNKKSKKKIEKFINKCTSCNINKHMKCEKIITTGKYSSAIPFEKITVDIKGPIPIDNFENNINNLKFYILVITDAYSGYSKSVVLTDIKTEDIKDAIQTDRFNKYRKPQILLSDKGRQFISTVLK